MYNHSVTYRQDELPMPAVTPLCRAQLVPNSFAMCRSAASARNSFRFCTYKTASYLHIPQPLKVPQFQEFASKPSLTPLVCADTQSGGWGGAPDRTPYTYTNAPPKETPGTLNHPLTSVRANPAHPHSLALVARMLLSNAPAKAPPVRLSATPACAFRNA